MIDAQALQPQSWPFDPALLPESAHLVGGSVRDALLHRQADYLDLDFVLAAQAIRTAQQLARRYQAGFVVLDRENQIARVVFERATIDFAQQVGPTLEADLRRRDFTVNAIAYHPKTDRLIDPLAGIDDLKAQKICMVCAENLAEDPLRLLRAYRQAAQLGFTIDPATRSTICHLAPLLKTIAAERVHHELDALLSRASGTHCLQMAWEDGLLSDWLPHLEAFHLQRLADIDDALDSLAAYPDFLSLLWGWQTAVPPGHYRSWVKIAKLAQIMPADEAEAVEQLALLKYSRSETQAVLKVLQSRPDLDQLQQAALTRQQTFFLFKSAGKSFAAVALVAIARGCPLDRLLPLIAHYQIPNDPLAHPPRLVTGRILMQQVGVRPGPQVGTLLAAIEQAQATGEITTEAEAIAWATHWLSQLNSQQNSAPPNRPPR